MRLNSWLASLLLVCSLTATAAAAGVRIAGRVTNSTTNGGAAGATVELMRPAPTGQPWRLIASTTADAGGRFEFAARPLPGNDILIARVSWHGYSYDGPAYDGAGRLKQFDPSLVIDPTNVALQVFDTTTEPPPLTATVHHVAIETQERDLKCTERLVLENATRRTFIGAGSQHTTVVLEIPKAAREVALDPEMKDAKLTRTAQGVEISLPITPAAYNNRNAIIFSYLMSWPASAPWDRSIDLSRTLRYPTKLFFVARTEADRKLVVTAPQLGPDQDQPLPLDNGTETRIVNSIGRPMGDKAALGSGTQVAIKVSRAINPLVWAFVAFVVALCLMVPLALLRARRGPGQVAGADAPFKIEEPVGSASVFGGTPAAAVGKRGSQGPLTEGQIPVAARDLIENIARLDEQFERGEVESQAYQSQRSAWKDRLVELLGSR